MQMSFFYGCVITEGKSIDVVVSLQHSSKMCEDINNKMTMLKHLKCLDGGG